ncbi:MAG TPA: class I SAM-dependent methyltransferase [Candidatus Binatia bacterium]|nr:class I SAM-dependent methyltransferase [Candidatus Binatia bacterium]
MNASHAALAEINSRPKVGEDPNLAVYDSAAVARHYAGLNYLTACEQKLFAAYLKPGSAILDLGVGGGRTTPYLSGIAARYVGLDYAAEMISICRSKFPALEFAVGDAADLSRFESGTFGAAVMAFNGMDYVIPDDRRLRALREIARVLKPEGVLIFSSHNPRSIFIRPSWDSQRVRRLAERIAGQSSFVAPVVWFLTLARVLAAAAVATFGSLARILKRLFTGAFWTGDGYWRDPAHGGLETHGAIPAAVVRETQACGFQSVRILGDDYPRPSRVLVTDWYYYVFSKIATGEK